MVYISTIDLIKIVYLINLTYIIYLLQNNNYMQKHIEHIKNVFKIIYDKAIKLC